MPRLGYDHTPLNLCEGVPWLNSYVKGHEASASITIIQNWKVLDEFDICMENALSLSIS